MDSYRTLRGEGAGQIEEKKSRFIAALRHVESEEEAQAFIAEKKKQYWDARHNCSAYILGPDGALERCSDDGEPSRTAGMPMLEVLKGEGLSDVCLVVTRYFGGILLGTGGLVRAYQAAARAGIEGSEITERRLMNRLAVTTDYNGYGRLQYFAAQLGIDMQAEFTDKVRAELLADDGAYAELERRMTEATAGRCVFELLAKDYVDVRV